MARTIAIIQSKGGTGKTTLTMHLAAALASKGRSAVVVDSDPQTSAYDWSSEAGGLAFPVVATPTPRLMEGEVKQYASSDYILIDTPPGGAALIRAAIELADLILIPTGVSPMDMRRTQVTLDALHDIDTPVAVVLSNVDRREKLLDEVHSQLASDDNVALADAVIPSRASMRRAFGQSPQVTETWKALAQEIEDVWEG